MESVNTHMLNYGSNTIDTLFKYAPKCISNNKICPKELVGKIPIKPDRTRFKLGIYLTSCRNLFHGTWKTTFPLAIPQIKYIQLT